MTDKYKIVDLGTRVHTMVYESETSFMVTTADPAPAHRDLIAEIPMQTGPTSGGVNGLFIEDLLIMAKLRINKYNQGDWVCEENNKAIECIDAALGALNSRTESRRQSGKLGTDQA